ncbi:hypothetical protein [Tritonibacter scottomollicae]|uniref:hypothetical protein n=1 Tax=Tritonibacter scottomollicae TaxID=483013 RepID=UPI0010571D5D|nr:hypothetical protein [Tritonibacter scottomollicae]
MIPSKKIALNAIETKHAQMCNFSKRDMRRGVRILSFISADALSLQMPDKVTARVVAVPYARVRDDRRRMGIAYRWNNGDMSVRWSA